MASRRAVHLHGGEDRLFECLECDSTGRVTKAHRDELLQWQGQCRLRPLCGVSHAQG